MNIWSILGISVALVAAFCIATGELLQPTRFYELHKWGVCGGLIVFGAIVYGGGVNMRRRLRARHAQAQAKLPEGERDSDPTQWEPFLLFNPAYWGVMIVSFGCILVFFVPTHSKREKGKVAARAPEPRARKAPAPPPPPQTNAVVPAPPAQVPKFILQGITLRESNPSALIDGRTYFVGDWVKDAQVSSIDLNRVVLEWRGIKVTLSAPR